MDIKNILNQIAKKYPNNNYILVMYDDESGRLCRSNIKGIYDQEAILEFSDISELVSLLWKNETPAPPDLPKYWELMAKEPSEEELSVMNENAKQLLLELGE